jgi:hypothetical protein
MKFIHEPGPDGEPTLWVIENGDTDHYRYTYLLSRVDLLPDVRRFWPDVVARMTGTTITNNDATVQRMAIAMWDADDAARITDGEADMIIPRNNQQVMSEYLGHASAALAALTGVPHD